MIKVMMKDGTQVMVPKGVVGRYTIPFIKESKETPTGVGATLEIKEGTDYSAKVVASFKMEEIVGYTVDEFMEDVKPEE